MDELTMSLSKRVGERVMFIILGVLSLNEEEFVRRTVTFFRYAEFEEGRVYKGKYGVLFKFK